MTIHIRIERHGAFIRQHCPACGGETWKHNVQAYCFEDDNPIAIGALCEVCLQVRQMGNLMIHGRVPSYESLAHRRAEEDASTEQNDDWTESERVF